MLCSRARPPPVKKASSVCAATWTTLSPSIFPGQPRSSASSRGVNMTHLTSGLGVDDHVGNVRTRVADPRLHLARATVRLGQRTGRVEAERQEGDEPLVRLQEAQLARLASERLADDARDDADLGVDVL